MSISTLNILALENYVVNLMSTNYTYFSTQNTLLVKTSFRGVGKLNKLQAPPFLFLTNFTVKNMSM